MGGGDLNLKKSWHPSTLRNIERVWKAEQKHEVEKQKIEQLQKELAEERAREEIQAYAEDQGVVKKREERLDWMYQGPAAMVNREDYLLGRKIDKTLDLLQHQESGAEAKKDDFDIGSTVFSSQDLSGTATVDLANKIREDPLFSIMKKEKEQKKNLLSNPVKMKQLQQLLQESLGKGKKKKSKKHARDTEEKHKHQRKNHHHSPDKEDQRAAKNKQKSFANDKGYRGTQSSCSYDDTPSKDKEQSHSSKYTKKDFGHHFSSHESYYKKSHYHNHEEKYSKSRREVQIEERDRRLREMQENAKWRDEQRERNVKRYRNEDEREMKAEKMDASDFIRPMLSRAAEKGSVANRVKQKIFSIQRSSADMDKHFVRH